MFLNGPVKNDGRVIRIISTLSQRFKVYLFYINGSAEDYTLFNQNVKLNSFEYSPSTYQSIFFLHQLDFLGKEALKAQISFDLIYCNDLPTLSAGVNLKQALQVPLIYDSHEIFIETLNQFFPSPKGFIRHLAFPFLTWVMKYNSAKVERKLIQQIDRLITVNKSLANYFKERYKLGKVSVVMNCPELAEDEVIPINFRKEFSWSTEDKIFIYQGVLNKGRGLHLLIEAIFRVDERIKLVIVGDGLLRSELEDKVKQGQLSDRVIFLGKVDFNQLKRYTIGADFGINLLEPFNLSKEMASPNKLFEYIHASLPVICSDTIENRQVLTKYRIGTMTKNNSSELAKAMEKMAFHDDLISFKTACTDAKHFYSWKLQAVSLNRTVNALLNQSEISVSN